MSDETPTSWRFNRASWDMSDVIGWLLYRDPKNFGDFFTPGDIRQAILHIRNAGIIFQELINALQSGALKALRNGKEIPSGEWFVQEPLHQSLIRALKSGVLFRRADVLKHWPLSEAAQSAPKTHLQPASEMHLDEQEASILAPETTPHVDKQEASSTAQIPTVEPGAVKPLSRKECAEGEALAYLEKWPPKQHGDDPYRGARADTERHVGKMFYSHCQNPKEAAKQAVGPFIKAEIDRL